MGAAIGRSYRIHIVCEVRSLHKLAIAGPKQRRHPAFQESGYTGFYVSCNGRTRPKLLDGVHRTLGVCLSSREVAACLAMQLLVGRWDSCGVGYGP